MFAFASVFCYIFTTYCFVIGNIILKNPHGIEGILVKMMEYVDAVLTASHDYITLKTKS